MNSSALSILKALNKRGPLTLSQLDSIIPKNHGGFEDFYILASLVHEGFINEEFSFGHSKDDAPREMRLAQEYFSCKDAERQAEYRGFKWQTSSDTPLKDKKFYLSGKGSIKLSEHSQRRIDTVISMIVSIIVGVSVALIVLWLNPSNGS
ncbi:MAG: hypothetical protein ACRBEE_13940 [Arenicella sp.]